jgi:hypothetical protein
MKQFTISPMILDILCDLASYENCDSMNQNKKLTVQIHAGIAGIIETP